MVHMKPLRKALRHIDAHPDEWDQSHYIIRFLPETAKVYAALDVVVPACGTAGCLAGTVVLQAGATLPPLDSLTWYADQIIQLTALENPAPYSAKMRPQRLPARVSATFNVVMPDGRKAEVAPLAEDLLGLCDEDAEDLFNAQNTRWDLQMIAKRIAREAGKKLNVELPAWAVKGQSGRYPGHHKAS